SPICRMIEPTQPKIHPPTAPSSAIARCPCPLRGAVSAASAPATLRRTLEHWAAVRGQDSEVFDALDTMRRRHRRADLASWPPRMSHSLDDEPRFQMPQAGP